MPNENGAPKQHSLREVVSDIDNERDLRGYIVGQTSRVPARTTEIQYHKHPVSYSATTTRNKTLIASSRLWSLQPNLLQAFHLQRPLVYRRSSTRLRPLHPLISRSRPSSLLTLRPRNLTFRPQPSLPTPATTRRNTIRLLTVSMAACSRTIDMSRTVALLRPIQLLVRP